MTLRFDELAAEVELEQFARQYVDLIYASALRQMTGDATGAADVTQVVMVILIIKSQARQLPKEGIMAGWLLNVTRHSVMQYKRAAARRAHHEMAAANLAVAEIQTSQIETDIRTALDSAILSLGATDREVIVRRYLRGENLTEIAAAVGMTENTTGRRIARALEKLRKILARRGVAAPAIAMAAVFTAETATRAPAAIVAMPTAGSLSLELASKVIWKMTIAKVVAAICATLLFLALVAGLAGRILQIRTAQTPAPIPPPAPAIIQDSPGPVTIGITKILESTSDTLLKQLLAGLRENQQKFHSIHVIGTDLSEMYDGSRKTWIGPFGAKGEAWMEAASPRRTRVEVSDEKARTFNPPNGFSPVQISSYIESWDGSSVRRLYGPPHSPARAEIFDSKYLKGEAVIGKTFSMQLPWDEETAGDSQGKTIKVIDRNPLDPAVLAKAKLSARRVILDTGLEAMELSIDNSDSTIGRLETFWFDPHRGYALLARRDTMSLSGTVVRQMTRIVKQLTEATPGIFYPSKGVMDWEERGNLFMWGKFEATTVIANEPVTQEMFHVTIPRGMAVVDFKGAIGTKRIEK